MNNVKAIVIHCLLAVLSYLCVIKIVVHTVLSNLFVSMLLWCVYAQNTARANLPRTGVFILPSLNWNTVSAGFLLFPGQSLRTNSVVVVQIIKATEANFTSDVG